MTNNLVKSATLLEEKKRRIWGKSGKKFHEIREVKEIKEEYVGGWCLIAKTYHIESNSSLINRLLMVEGSWLMDHGPGAAAKMPRFQNFKASKNQTPKC